ncbi:sugar fermentation stimulation protein A [Clostridium homopropionicum DSM 5847]|uniref:Sugar fermentation stimulation protein homolog n=1 Tax=Clostridium homopropionicum DSM 5847 TaxID=1121318 RepID=A0A0L6ZAQ6_9CLOT|nr:DNA/RNA nuclease SfsA [Clostridium homopropionicum]KOA20059.1 sugar fermentation stimulation protein A [Clostridium homopropionicum DSM 5847]SFG85522.1 sugar fermentation stimulation protein A [Clostridium homopropionicum]
MIYNNNIITAEFIKRPNRFVAYVKINDKEEIVHVPNTGRCREILTVGSTVVLSEGKNKDRKTKYDLIAGYKDSMLINIDSQVPNAVVEEALKNRKIRTLMKYPIIQREKFFGNSRFDFKLSNGAGEEYYLEVKGVTLENEGHCMFPDAPTDRGRKHLLELVEVCKTGRGAGVLFLIQLKSAKTFSPHRDMDKDFAEALRFAKENGVDVWAYDCNVGENFIELNKKVKVIF